MPVTNARPIVEKLAKHLYYVEPNDYVFAPMPKESSELFPFGCSTVRKGSLFGRNLDLGSYDTPEFVVRLQAAKDRFASIGICADMGEECPVSDMPTERILSTPFITNDGVNENGVIVSVHVADPTGVDDRKGTAAGKEKLHASRVVRYLLDHARSAEHAVDLLRVRDIVGGFSQYAVHWMIADEKDTFVAEIIGGKVVVSRNEHYWMTNFYLNYGPVQPKQTVAGNAFVDLPLLTEYPIGVERWCALRDGYDAAADAQDMARLMESVKGTAMYRADNDPLWLTECTGGEISSSANSEAFSRELARQTGLYRTGVEPQEWRITWHTSVYDLESRTLTLYSQENYTKRFTFPFPARA